MNLIDCQDCGKKVSARAASCPNCGCPVSALPVEPMIPEPSCAAAQIAVESGHRPGFVFGASPKTKSSDQPEKSPKDRGIYIALALLLGGLGIHNFYAGHFIAGAGQFLCTMAVLVTGMWLGTVLVGAWVIFDCIFVKTDGKGRTL